MENVNVYYFDLPSTIKAFVVRYEDYYTIILNSRNSFEQNQLSYWHEMAHIMHGDFSRCVDVNVLESVRHGRPYESCNLY